MKKFVLIPDSFKGTLSSIEICDILEAQIKKKYQDALVVKVPIADGGEGTVDAILYAVKGERVFVEVSDPFFKQIKAYYGLIDNGKTAIIEMASCCGLPLVENNLNPLLASTFGVGELIKHALDKGVRKLIVGLGGSATNDGGTGCAAALGVKFYNKLGDCFIPVGGSLNDISSIDIVNLDKRLADIELVSMCDVINQLYGPNGASFVFGPQKGANPQMVITLDNNLQHLAAIVEKDLGFKNWDFYGAGAAGGMGYGMKAFLNSDIKKGLDTILNIVNFDKLINDADYIFTGEGKLDKQSLQGKVVIGVARRALVQGKKVVCIVGSLEEEGKQVLNEGVNKIIVTNYLNLSFDEVKKRAKKDMIKVVSDYLKLLE